MPDTGEKLLGTELRFKEPTNCELTGKFSIFFYPLLSSPFEFISALKKYLHLKDIFILNVETSTVLKKSEDIFQFDEAMHNLCVSFFKLFKMSIRFKGENPHVLS